MSINLSVCISTDISNIGMINTSFSKVYGAISDVRINLSVSISTNIG